MFRFVLVEDQLSPKLALTG